MCVCQLLAHFHENVGRRYFWFIHHIKKEPEAERRSADSSQERSCAVEDLNEKNK